MFLPRKENIMLTKYERELVNYWKNWKPGMGVYGGEPEEIEDDKVDNVEVNVNVNCRDLAEDIIDRMWDII